MTGPARPYAGFGDRATRLREALSNAEFTDEVQMAIHYLAHWFNDGELDHVIHLIDAARIAEWRSIIDIRTRGGIYRGTAVGSARLEEVKPLQR